MSEIGRNDGSPVEPPLQIRSRTEPSVPAAGSVSTSALSSERLMERAHTAWKSAYSSLESRADPDNPDPLLAWSTEATSTIACNRYRYKHPCKADPLCNWKSGKCLLSASSENLNEERPTEDLNSQTDEEELSQREKAKKEKKKNKAEKKKKKKKNKGDKSATTEAPHATVTSWERSANKAESSGSGNDPVSRSRRPNGPGPPNQLACADPCLSSLPPESGSCSEGLLAKRQKDGQFERATDPGGDEGGWRSLSSESYITWSFGGMDRPVVAGWSRASVRIRGMEPDQWASAKGTKHHVFAMHSRSGGAKSASAIGNSRENSLASYWAVKVGREYVSRGNIAGLKFVWAFAGSKSRREFRLPAWDWLARRGSEPNNNRPAAVAAAVAAAMTTDLRFAVQWNASHISFFLDTNGSIEGGVWGNAVVQDAPFGPRSEELAHVWVGRDPDTPGFAGPIYSDLTVQLSRPNSDSTFDQSALSLHGPSASLSPDRSDRLLQLPANELVARLRQGNPLSRPANDKKKNPSSEISQRTSIVADKQRALDDVEQKIRTLELLINKQQHE